jgi:hypothetical protein
MMKQKIMIFSLLLLPGSFRNPSQSDNSVDQFNNIAVAKEFINAFYSFNSDTLASILSHASESQPSILYYQKWAECGNYIIIKKHNFFERNDSLIICPITVKDDLIGALNIDFNVTDTFHLTIIDGQIHSVQTSSNDPDLYYEAKQWVRQNRPQVIQGPCMGILEGGPTPCDCVRAMVKGFTEFIATKN